jgi:anti-sigma factor RsiW
MCPENQILSVYFDGELPSPWKEKMEAHLAACPACREKLEGYRLSKGVLTGRAEEKTMLAAKDRVWQNLSNRRPIQRPSVIRPIKNVWRRQVSLPLPAAAAAAAVFILISFFAVFGGKGPSAKAADNAISANVDMNVQGIVPVSSMSEVLQYLSNQDSSDFVLIRLPETRNFSSYGEPTILKAADYSRRKISQ